MDRERVRRKDNSKLVLAIVLIAFGGLWLLRKIGFYIEFPAIHLHEILFPVRNFFSGLGDFFFSWQVIFILIGLLLLAGKRSGGLILIVIGGIFLLPKIIFFPPLTLSFLFPALLIGAGIVMVAEKINNEGSESEVADKVSDYPREENLDRIVVKDRHKINIIPVDEVRYIESMDDYVMIYTSSSRHMKQKTMKYFEGALDPNHFIRIHRSYIVKVEEINEIQQYEKESYIVILHDKTKLKVSKTGYKNLKEILNF